MGPREKALREEAERCFPPDATEYFRDPLARVGLERRQILDALEEALNGWEYAAGYKGEFLAKKARRCGRYREASESVEWCR